MKNKGNNKRPLLICQTFCQRRFWGNFSWNLLRTLKKKFFFDKKQCKKEEKPIQFENI